MRLSDGKYHWTIYIPSYVQVGGHCIRVDYGFQYDGLRYQQRRTSTILPLVLAF